MMTDADWRDEAEALRDRELGFFGQRSPKWRALREAFLIDRCCIVCGGRNKLVAHHRLPFHRFSELELVVANLRPICEDGPAGMNCHLLAGHGGNYRDWNEDVDIDALAILAMISERTRG